MKVLVAEDDRATRTRLLAYLKEWGLDVLEAADGEEAWKLYQDEDISLVVTDWLMPRLDGVELLRRIRESAEKKNYLYCILLTSRSEMSDLVQGMEAGADDFVGKPFDKDELRVRIQAGLRVLELEHALAEQNRRLATANDVLVAANTRMKESLEAAAKIQQSFLPERPPETPKAEFAWIYEPCEELGGDTLNVVPLAEDVFAVYLMDVSGHGVPAALLSVHLSRILTRLDGPDSLVRTAGEGGEGGEIASPVEVLGALNQRFGFEEGVQQYFTAIYGVYDAGRGEFRYSSAGHPGPLVVSHGSAELRKATPPAVGFLPAARFKEQCVSCQAGDRLYFYTDGIFEVTNAAGEQYGEERLAEGLESLRDRPLLESLQALREMASAWSDGRPFEDDVSLLGVEVR